jgi:hypothetical protein
MIRSNELEIKWRKVVMAYFKVVYQHLVEGLRKTMKNSIIIAGVHSKV